MFALIRPFLLSPSFLPQSIVLSSFGIICLQATRPVTETLIIINTSFLNRIVELDHSNNDSDYIIIATYI